MTWDQALAEWAAWLAEVEGALERSDWGVVEAAGTWTRPERDLPPPTPEQIARAGELQARADALRPRLETALAEVAERLGDSRRRAAAERRYLEH